jgi:hypothetical protein
MIALASTNRQKNHIDLAAMDRPHRIYNLAVTIASGRHHMSMVRLPPTNASGLYALEANTIQTRNQYKVSTSMHAIRRTSEVSKLSRKRRLWRTTWWNEGSVGVCIEASIFQNGREHYKVSGDVVEPVYGHPDTCARSKTRAHPPVL